jgi:DNA-binding PadR family transcriptional regulator
MSPTETKNQSNLKQIDFLVLAVLQNGPLHGYGIVQRLEEMTEGAVALRPGDVYRVLYRMQRANLLAPSGEAETPTGRRANYAITSAGERLLSSQAEILAGVAAKVLATGGHEHVG